MDVDDSQQLLGWFEGTVIDPLWSNSRAQSEGKYTGDGADTIKAYWHVSVDKVHQDYDKMAPPTTTVSFGIGEKWHVDPENPNVVRHEDDPGEAAIEAGDGKPILIKGSSVFGKVVGLSTGKYESYFTQTAVDPMVRDLVVLDDGPPVEYEMYGVADAMRARGITTDSRDISIWRGARFLFRGVGIPYRNTQGTPRFQVLPFAFLGFDEDVASGAESSSAGLAGRPVSIDPADVANLCAADTPAEAVEELAKLLSTSNTHTEFMRAALRIVNGQKLGEDVKAAVMNEDGLWALRTAPAES